MGAIEGADFRSFGDDSEAIHDLQEGRLDRDLKSMGCFAASFFFALTRSERVSPSFHGNSGQS